MALNKIKDVTLLENQELKYARLPNCAGFYECNAQRANVKTSLRLKTASITTAMCIKRIHTPVRSLPPCEHRHARWLQR